MEQVEKIEIGFENFDFIEFNADEIGNFDISPTSDNDSSKEYTACGKVFIEFLPNADKAYLEFGMTKTKNTFFRISNFRDITYIKISRLNGKQELIYVPWKDDDENECENQYQTSYISNKHSLCVSISAE